MSTHWSQTRYLRRAYSRLAAAEKGAVIVCSAFLLLLIAAIVPVEPLRGMMTALYKRASLTHTSITVTRSDTILPGSVCPRSGKAVTLGAG